MTREWTGAVLGVLGWCLIVMAMGVSNAHGFWEWTWTFLFGAVAPVVLLRLVADLLATHQSARTSPADERRLLEALSEGGELTAAAASVRTSLALDDVAMRLESMAARGHVEVRLADDVELYSLTGWRRDTAIGP